jgi:hypothetical protein
VLLLLFFASKQKQSQKRPSSAFGTFSPLKWGEGDNELLSG